MRATLGLLVAGLSSQAVFGKVDGLRGEPTNVRQEEVVSRSYHRNLQVRSVAGGEREQPSEPIGGGGAVTSSFSVSGIVANIGRGSTVTIRFIVTVAAPDGTTEEFGEEVEVGPDGTGDLDIGTEVCAACTTTVVAAECVSGECDGYNEKETNDNVVAILDGQ